MQTEITTNAPTTTHRSASRQRPMSTHRVGPIIAGSLIAGFVTALTLTLGLFSEKAEPVVTGVILLAFAASWAAIALLSTRWTDQPQRWAAVPAVCMAVLGAGLIAFSPTTHTLSLLGWEWPLLLIGLVVWMVVQAHRQLHSHARRWMLYPVFGVLVLAALGGGFESVSESLNRSASAMHGQLIDVGGHRLHIDCSGAGGPTVVLEAGFGGDSTSWAWIAPEVAHDSRVCVYDRAGTGWSEPAAGPQDGVVVANDLHTLLSRAGEPGPYVLVGHSLGGAFVLNFAARYPNDVAGVVLLDSMHPEQYTRVPGYSTFYNGYRRISALFPPLARVGVGRLAAPMLVGDLPPAEQAAERDNVATPRVIAAQHAEWTMIPTTLHEAQLLTTLGDRPLMVVTAGRGMQDGWMHLQDELATLSTNSIHRVIPGATHAALLEDESFTDESSRAIHDLVMLARQTE